MKKYIIPDDNDNDIIIKSFDQNIDFTNFLYTYLYLTILFSFPYIFQILQIQYRLLQGLLQWLIGEIVWVPLKTTFWDLHVSIVESSKVKQVGRRQKCCEKKKFLRISEKFWWKEEERETKNVEFFFAKY